MQKCMNVLRGNWGMTPTSDEDGKDDDERGVTWVSFIRAHGGCHCISQKVQVCVVSLQG